MAPMPATLTTEMLAYLAHFTAVQPSPTPSQQRCFARCHMREFLSLPAIITTLPVAYERSQQQFDDVHTSSALSAETPDAGRSSSFAAFVNLLH